MGALPDSLRAACARHGATLTGRVTLDGAAVDGPTLLLAISGNESTYGQRREFARAEPAYLPGGVYFRRSPAVRQHWSRWGVLAGSSFGSWQIMFVTATELGFDGHPIDLQDDDVCAQWAAALIRKRLIARDGAKTLQAVLDGYNSGTPTDRIVPQKYIDDGVANYRRLIATHGGSRQILTASVG